MRKLWLNRKAVSKNQSYPSWTLHIQTMGWLKGVKTSIQSMPFLFLQDLFSSGLRLLRAGLVLLFILKGRGISAYPTLPTFRLFNYYFLGPKETEAN